MVAPDFVPVVLGEKWAEPTILIQILAGVGLLQSLQTLNPNILQALDRTTTLLRYTIVFFGFHLIAFASACSGASSASRLATSFSSLVVEPLFTWVTTRALDVSPLVLVRGLSGVVQPLR